MVHERNCRDGGPKAWVRSLTISGRFRLACLAMLVAMVATSVPVAANAQEAELDIPVRRRSFTPGELALLPPYCNAQQGMPDYEGPGGAQWRRWMGKDLQHIHHYCRGLRDVMFATMMARVTPPLRKSLWGRAIDEYEYMIRNSAPTMPLLPEIQFKRGEALLQLNRMAEAEEAFKQSRLLKPDYWPPYAAWADKLVELRLFARARETLEEGLEHAPQEPQLRQRLQRLPAASSSSSPPAPVRSGTAPHGGG